MKESDKIINYRPELGTYLKKCLDYAIKFYNTNFQKFYYEALAIVYKDTNPELAALLQKTSDCFNNSFASGFEQYEYELSKYNIYYVSMAKAAYIFFAVFESEFDNQWKQIDTNGFTKTELYMIKHFFGLLKAPMRDPNLRIKKGEAKCYYDKDLRVDYKESLEQSVACLTENCQSIIDMFVETD